MPRISGKIIIVIMFTLGIAFASGMVLYWDLHTRPFRRLQQLLKEQYPAYQISISGGTALKSPGKPEKLRVVLHEINKSNSEIDLKYIAESVIKLVPEHAPQSDYDLLEIHLISAGNTTSSSHRSYIKSFKSE